MILDWVRKLLGLKRKASQPSQQLCPKCEYTVSHRLLLAHNEERQKYDVPELQINYSLQSAAEDRVLKRWMFDEEDYREVHDFLDNMIGTFGYTAKIFGENIAYGFETVESVMDEWMRSEAHRLNILRPEFEQCGLAKVGEYWCVIFGAPTSKQKDAPVLHRPEIINHSSRKNTS